MLSIFGGGSSGPSSLSQSKWPEKLKKQISIFDRDEKNLIGQLLSAGQEHLFENWDDINNNDDLKHEMLASIKKLHTSTSSTGGLFAYLKRAKELLAASQRGDNPFDGWLPEVPDGVSLNPEHDSYYEYEDEGLKELGHVGFVLVAGGLGERLGYHDIKVALPVEMTTRTSYLEWYIQQILAIQTRYGNGRKLPLAIMVSDDTEAKTVALLKRNSYFGMDEQHVHIMKQEKVAALIDNDARMATKDNYTIDSKPHGHGDVHALMYSSGTASAWYRSGTRYVVFFQDTNGLSFKTLPAMIGVSKKLGLEVNSLAVPRVAKQAVGAITKLVRADNGKEMTINVEYNQLDPLLRATINNNGDTNDSNTGLSPFPGNINQLVFKMGPYMRNLFNTGGIMTEFVNPKYADKERTRFKKPTRLECMMQDYPKILSSAAKVGFTMAPSWLCYSPCKNNAKDAAEMAKNGVPGGSAVTAEADQYNVNSKLLRIFGCTVDEPGESYWKGIPAKLGPAIVFHPNFAIFPGEIKAKFPQPQQISISSRSTLIVDGVNVRVENIRLDGALRLVTSGSGELEVHCDHRKITKNRGYRFVSGPGWCNDDEVIAMRGYMVEREDEDVSIAGDGQKMVFADHTDLEQTVTMKYYLSRIIYERGKKEECCNVCSIM